MRGPARVLCLAALAALGCRERGRRAVSAAAAAPPAPRPGDSFVVLAAGDVAGRWMRADLTADLLLDLIERHPVAAILALGDLQYPRGDYHDFLADYDPTWGHPALLARTRPVPGNHEYARGTSDADGYFDYFNGTGALFGRAGERGKGYYSFDLGDWHFVALNTSDACRRVPCGADSEMHRWLKADLAANARPCTLAYFHHPRFLRGRVHEDEPAVAALWDALYDARADVVLSGHEHSYQQLRPLDKRGQVDWSRGLRSFVVGTGGARLYRGAFLPDEPGVLEARLVEYGVLALTLGPGRYQWRFVVAGDSGGAATAAASGEGRCRGRAGRSLGDPPPPGP